MTTVLIAIAALLGLAALFGAVLGYASEKFKVEGDPIVEQIDALLPWHVAEALTPCPQESAV